MSTADLPAWCPPPLAAASSSRAKGPLAGLSDTAAQVRDAAKQLHAEHAERGGVELMFVHLAGREQSVALCVRESEGGDVLEVLSLADDAIDDTKAIAALAANGRPRLAGFVLIDVDGSDHLFARASNLVETLDDEELQRMIRSAARLADEWEARQSQGGDQW